MVVSEPQIALLVGDAFRCERALAEREAALREADPAYERHVLFGDELDPAAFEIELRSASLFSLGRHFAVRQIDRTKAAKATADALDGEIPQGTFVTLIASELPGTNPILKVCKARHVVVPLPAPRGRAVATAARDVLASIGIEASPGAIRLLVLRTGGSLLGIAQEARKIRALAPGTPITEEVVDRVAFPSAERTVYPFFDRLGERTLPGALAALADLREESGRLLSGAIRHLARLAMIRAVQEGKGPRQRLSDAVGLPDWLCKRLADQAKHHTLDSLSLALRAGVSLDLRMKRGELSPDDALLQLVFAATAPA
jgi:DNA polymerase III delta subunit